MNALYFAIGGMVLISASIGAVVWRFRKTMPVEEFKKKYDDL